jgi:hypothetical protein
MKYLLLAGAATLALSLQPAFAADGGHRNAAGYDRVITAEAGGGNGGAERQGYQLAEEGGGGNGHGSQLAEAGGGNGGTDRQLAEEGGGGNGHTQLADAGGGSGGTDRAGQNLA